MWNQNHTVVLYYERSLRNNEGNKDIIATLIWVTARTSLGTTALAHDTFPKHIIIGLIVISKVNPGRVITQDIF